MPNETLTSAPEHDAPPPYRPLSVLAVVAVVAALFLLPLALMGPWWIEGVPVLLVVFAWGPISDGRARGKVPALVACGIAVVVAVVSYASAATASAEIGERCDALLTALVRGEVEPVSRWALEGEDAGKALERWGERMAAAQRELGPYAGPPRVPWGLWGPYAGLVVPPASGLVEVGASADPVPDRPGAAFWFDTPFQRGRLWTALVLGPLDAKPEDLQAAVERAASPRQSFKFVREVRFFKAP